MATPFNLSDAFAAFETPDEVVDRRRSENVQRLKASRQDQTVQESSAAQFGSALAGLAEAATGGSREERMAREMQSAFGRINQVTGIPETSNLDALPESEAQAMVAAETKRIEETGKAAEARYLEQGLSEEEAQLAAFDDVIAGAQMPEVARNLVYMKAKFAEQVRAKRATLAKLKAEAVDEDIDRRIKQAELQKAEVEDQTMGLELLELQRARDDLYAQGLTDEDTKVQEINDLIGKRTARVGAGGEEVDKVTLRRRQRAFDETAENTLNSLDQVAAVREQLEREPNANTTVAKVASWVDSILQEAEAIVPGSRENMVKHLTALGDFADFGANAAQARQLATLMVLAQTDAMIQGIPSNIDLAKIEETVGQYVANPETREELYRNLVGSAMSRFRRSAQTNRQLDSDLYNEVEAENRRLFFTPKPPPADPTDDFTGMSTEDLLNQL